MFQSPFLLFSLLFLVSSVATLPFARAAASEWFTVEWNGVDFASMEGDLIIPEIPNPSNGGMASIWSGLQGEPGVLQTVLSRQTHISTLRNSFYGATYRPLGTPHTGVKPGDTFHFSFARIGTSGSWLSTLSGPQNTSETLPLSDLPLNRAILAVALTDVKHDFSVAYKNVTITAVSAPASTWCGKSWTLGYDKLQYIISNATADGTTCHISSIVLPSTA